MTDYRPDLAPREVHVALLDSLDVLRRAESRAVLWFAEVLKRRLYHPLGYASMELYAAGELGFSDAKTRQFLRLARQLDDLPAVRAAVADGSLPWTKARTVASVATPETEGAWLVRAHAGSARKLENDVKRSRRAAKVAPDAPSLLPVPEEPPPECPVTITLRLAPEQHARFASTMETLRKQGRGESREELLLEALAALTGDSGTRVPDGRSTNRVVLYRCEECGKASIDGRPVAPAVAAAKTCDAVIQDTIRGGPDRSTIPPSVRRAVLARDGHRCAAPGCRSRRFLEIHHVRPRSRGGGHDPANLVTLCSACHRLVHEKDGLAALRPAAVTPP